MSVLERAQLKQLMSYQPREGNKVLSLYLNVDPLDLANMKGGFKVRLDELLKKIEANIQREEDRELFSNYKDAALKYVEHLIPKGKTLVMFIDGDRNLNIQEELPIEITSQVYYRDYPVVRPILEVLEISESYLIVFMDRERARFLKLYLGTLSELKELSSEPPVKHRQTSGTDHLRSQMVLQRRAASWSNRFLKTLVDSTEELMETQAIDAIIVSGTEEVTAEFIRLLPRSLKDKVVGTIRLPLSARQQEILEAVLPIVSNREFLAEKELVEDLLTSAQKGEKAVLGLNPTLSAINEGRVYLLLYPETYSVSGFRCDLCGVLLDHIPETGKCPYCEEKCLTVEDLIEEACEKAFEMGGKVFKVRKNPYRKQLIESGILGAFLR